MNKLCPKCKTENSADSKFCRHCGTPLQTTLNSAMIVVRKHSGNGRSRPVDMQMKMQTASEQSSIGNNSNSQQRSRRRVGGKSKAHSFIDSNPLFWKIFLSVMSFGVPFCLTLYVDIPDKLFLKIGWILLFPVLSTLTLVLITRFVTKYKEIDLSDIDLYLGTLGVLIALLIK